MVMKDRLREETDRTGAEPGRRSSRSPLEHCHGAPMMIDPRTTTDPRITTDPRDPSVPLTPPVGRELPPYRGSWGPGKFVLSILAMVLIVGGLAYLIGQWSGTTGTGTASNPATTVGQSGANVSPGAQQNVPNPTPPAPPTKQ
jgi:hypothetical protein